MRETRKTSRCGFIVVKLNINGEAHFLMRKNPKWKDVNFIGGHEQLYEGGNLRRAAGRELLEEVPPMRTFGSFELEPLTAEVRYGPVLSRSASQEVEYILQFFLIRFNETPAPMLEKLGPRSQNILISHHDLTTPRFHRVSGLVMVLDDAIPGGLKSIPYSWPHDLGDLIRSLNSFRNNQLNLKLG